MTQIHQIASAAVSADYTHPSNLIAVAEAYSPLSPADATSCRRLLLPPRSAIRRDSTTQVFVDQNKLYFVNCNNLGDRLPSRQRARGSEVGLGSSCHTWFVDTDALVVHRGEISAPQSMLDD
jgi:hypothetical protein